MSCKFICDVVPPFVKMHTALDTSYGFISFQPDGKFHFPKKSRSMDERFMLTQFHKPSYHCLKSIFRVAEPEEGPPILTDLPQPEGGGADYAPTLLRNPSDFQTFQRHCLWSMQNAEPGLIRSRVFFSSSSFHTCTGELGVSKFSYIYFWPIFHITCYIEDFSQKVRTYLILDFISTR